MVQLLLHIMAIHSFMVPILSAHITQYSDGLVIPLYNRVGYIAVMVDIGDPSQTVELLLDSGSSVSWVVAEDNPYCKPGKDQQIAPMDCTKCGTYNSNDSKTFQASRESFHIEYFDNTTVSGFYATEKMNIPNMRDDVLFNLDDFEFGVGKKTNSSIGILGLGIPHFNKNDDSNGHKAKDHSAHKKLAYDRKNIITEFKKKGTIDRSIFSIWLDDRSAHGELAIGSIDEAKFQPPLVMVKLINYAKPNDPIKNFEIGLSGLSLNVKDFKTHDDDDDDDDNGDHDDNDYDDGNSMITSDLFEISSVYENMYIGALIDTGSVNTHLPIEIYNALVESLQNNYNIHGTINGFPKAPCFDEDSQNDLLKPENNLLSFRFNHVTLNIPLKSFLKRTPGDPNRLLQSQKAPGVCILGVEPQYDNITIIGQGFFRSVYTVFDLDKMELSMAPSIYTNKRSLRKVTIIDDLNAVSDGVIDSDLKQEMYDPSTEFVEDTSDGYYRMIPASKGTNLELTRLQMFIITIIVCLLLYL